MKFEISEKIVTSKAETEVLSLLLERFKRAAKSATLDGSTILVKSMGSISRNDTTTVSVKSNDGSCWLDASVNYRPGFMLWVWLVVLIPTGIGLLVPFLILGFSKARVKKGIETVFQRAKDELETPSVSRAA